MRNQLHSGFDFHPAYLDRPAQEALLTTLAPLIESAPFFRPTMPKTGKPFSVEMTNLGPLGWVSDKDGGYRYQAAHPVTGQAWPAIPQVLIDLWQAVAHYPVLPQACLVNLYREGAKMGLHVDSDERDRDAPVVSISLGDSAIFRLGGAQRGGPTSSLKLHSGDVVVLGGASRHFYHGIDRVLTGSSTLVPGGGRINLTMRVVG
ncbi:alpha-ketoglutarate-dependent dioxygenase AlkB [Aquidulcibacter sp.]|uniref:alpha-ketoglutarate-dependent dioxygenase AlkB family protein n=1 Tax=Aquidulcibacter sp. TaxID=2052990 RepID=UPI0025C0A320|nr:alpha-ketoglutarate-dependent dioxygenase AlkB [Aquidulcibacter sp.]MCA3698102.1 alpha-ketoglutarate-dependent dioxygenase AlkB [Aquidulcibacter sp.]